MIDPITASLAAGAGARLLDRLSAPLLDAAQAASSATSTTAASSAVFGDTFASAAKSAFQKLFAAHPELKAQLGEGPYLLKQNANGTLSLSSSATGQTLTLDSSTPTGQKATLLANSLELKNFQKGLELQAI